MRPRSLAIPRGGSWLQSAAPGYDLEPGLSGEGKSIPTGESIGYLSKRNQWGQWDDLSRFSTADAD